MDGGEGRDGQEEIIGGGGGRDLEKLKEFGEEKKA